MFVMWINLILFLRRLPRVGIYIVMVGEVFITFAKFFIFCFSLFIFAFGFTFFVLLRNQHQFSTPGYAFVKAGVMMIGELDFGSIFHAENSDEPGSIVHYEGVTYALFVTFLILVTIIITNLLVSKNYNKKKIFHSLKIFIDWFGCRRRSRNKKSSKIEKISNASGIIAGC